MDGRRSRSRLAPENEGERKPFSRSPSVGAVSRERSASVGSPRAGSGPPRARAGKKGEHGVVSDLKRKYGDRLRRKGRKQSVAALEAGSKMSSKPMAENDGSESPRRRGFHIPGFKRTTEDKGMDTLEQMRTLATAQQEPHSLKTEQEMQEWKKRTTAVIVIVAFSVFVTFAMLWLSMGSRAKFFRTVALSWCTADSCLEHAARLTESMDRTVQPCQDFYAYVCGKWKPYADETYISDVAGRMRASLQRANAIILFNGSSRQSSFKKVSATFQSCIERKSEDQASNIKKLKKFMFARGIPWPQDPPEDRHPLDVLLDLDINWGVPVLFKTRLFRNPLVAVVVRSNSLTDVVLGDEKLREYFEEGSVKKRMSAFYSIYTGETPSVGKLQRAQGIYVNIIQKAKIAIVDAEGFVRTNISYLQGPTSAISNSTNTWLALLKKHFRIYNTSNLNGSTEVVTNNVKLSAVVNELIETYAWKDILSAIGFWFVELYTSVAEDQLLEITFGSTATKMLPVVCYYQIEQRYGSAAMLTGYITNRFKTPNQDRVNDLLADLKYHVLAVLQKDQTEEVIHKVRSIRFRLWPSSSLESSLEKAFPSIQHAYIDFWTNTSASADSSLGLPLYDDLYGLPGLLDPFVEYSPLDNILTISLNVLSSPLYYNDGTRAIIYGGLGWQVARAIFKSTEGMACKEACSDSHGLEASFAAYKASLSTSESRALSIFDRPVKAGKVFFLSLVRGTCGTPGEHINAMLKKFPPFAKIYGCAATGKSRR